VNLAPSGVEQGKVQGPDVCAVQRLNSYLAAQGQPRGQQQNGDGRDGVAGGRQLRRDSVHAQIRRQVAIHQIFPQFFYLFSIFFLNRF
jgi:hypothetical protein